MTDLEAGKTALQYFHNGSTDYEAYKLSFEELIANYGKKADIYMDGIGMTIRHLELSQSAVREAMFALADKAQGKIPKDHQDYIRFLGNRAAEINWLEFAVEVGKETASQTVHGLATFGESVKTTLSWFTTLLPYLAIGGVVFYIYSFSKGSASSSTEGLNALTKAVKEKVKSTAKKLNSKASK